MKAFLSHSSADKAKYVRIVANALQSLDVIYDEFTFEIGGKTFEEILHGLDQTGVFVLFISNSSLNSEWVQKEIFEAKKRFDTKQISQIYPIIIDENITYEDSRIPEWLQDEYNLKMIARPTVVARRIHQKLRELSWERFPKLKRSQTFFLGRNQKQEEFETRYYDYNKIRPSVIFCSGFPNVGRRAFMANALIKANVLKQSAVKTKPIILDRSSSIEDFILKLNDLGLVELKDRINGLSDISVDEKIKITHSIMDELYKYKEIVFILDDGCINSLGKISQWFLDIILSHEKVGHPIFCVASRHKIARINQPKEDKFFFLDLQELMPTERVRLFTELLRIEEIELVNEDIEMFCNLFSGFPEQISFTVDLIKSNTSPLTDLLIPVRDFSSNKASVLLKNYENKDSDLDFIRLLAHFEIITLDFVFSIVDENEYSPLIVKLVSEGVCEFIGVNGDILRLNDIVRDYIKRNRFHLSDNYQMKVENLVRDSLSQDLFEKDSSEIIFTMKEALKNGLPIEEKLLIPSHYLRCIKDLYFDKGHLDRVVELCEIILQKSANIDRDILQDIRYYFCLALAKKQDPRVLKEVQSIEGAEHDFILGFYYRKCGQYDKALDRLDNAMNKSPFISSRCKREIVQVYVQLEDYTKALGYARTNYEENKHNQFHVQAYFNCIINSDLSNDKLLLELINELKTIGSDTSVEMGDIAEAMYMGRIKGEADLALAKLQKCSDAHKNNHYPLLALCDIAIQCGNLSVLEGGINSLEKLKAKKHLSSNTLTRYKACLLALKGQKDAAITEVGKLKNYPSNSKENLLTKINRLYEEQNKC